MRHTPRYPNQDRVWVRGSTSKRHARRTQTKTRFGYREASPMRRGEHVQSTSPMYPRGRDDVQGASPWYPNQDRVWVRGSTPRGQACGTQTKTGFGYGSPKLQITQDIGVPKPRQGLGTEPLLTAPPHPGQGTPSMVTWPSTPPEVCDVKGYLAVVLGPLQNRSAIPGCLVPPPGGAPGVLKLCMRRL